MKTKEEIQEKLTEVLKVQEHMAEWVRTSHEAYMKNKKMWGDQADDGETRIARNAHAEITAEVKALEWVLDINQSQPESLD